MFHRSSRRRITTIAGLSLTAVLLAGCSVVGSTESAKPTGDGGSSVESTTVTLVTHGSFNMDEQVLADFTERSGIIIKVIAQEDAGTLANQLVLTKGSPLADVVFGVDNTFASRVIDADVLEPYSPKEATEDLANFALDGGGAEVLSPIDYGDVCVNIDHEWFAEAGLAEPESLADLTSEDYRDLLVVQNPALSSPGLSFLLATVGAFGEDGWQDYWKDLTANGVKVSNGWTDAYTVEFSGSSGNGPRPLVVSYASSPPSEVPEGADEAPTGVLLDTCFRQIEYAGILAGTENLDAAQTVIDFLLSAEFQVAIPGEMYMYPVRSDVDLPEDWAKFAAVANEPHSVPAANIEANREDWIKTWADLVIG